MPDPVLLDVTLRDGGYLNRHRWTRGQAHAVLAACAAARVDLCEVGYFRPRHHERGDTAAPVACCPPDYLAELRERHPGVRLVVMARPGDTVPSDYRALAAAGAHCLRLTTAPNHLDAVAAHVEAAKAVGLRVTLNLVRVSELTATDVTRTAAAAHRYGADVLYLADSNGSLFPEQVTELVALAAAHAGDAGLGFHAHDGLSLAFINSLSAAAAGCRYLDASLGGVGKGGGNLSLELIAGYLRTRATARYATVPLARAVPAVLHACGDDVPARFDAIASGLLDLNIDDLRVVREQNGELAALVDARTAPNP
ncbi:hypothetical protein V5P93_006246 [Actinokineospora auranticolor]|uniref:4-hydroxy 2-oxovalerate aldolase n=1 Tax=Actinokineospora auranticolor TaxID=155976 RepID=A0A2S6GI29_9PSEU|nr:pyruvate carboxyltransferase [Actinokineospora auranticolor]PPK64843.1 4-hydroxy 2-oxovalerate aldolase [Actinokineospora auranticolor]